MSRNKKKTKIPNPRQGTIAIDSGREKESAATDSRNAETGTIRGADPDIEIQLITNEREKNLIELAKREAAIVERETSIQIRESTFEYELAKQRQLLLSDLEVKAAEISQLVQSLSARTQEIGKERSALIERLEELHLRETKVTAAELELEGEFAQRRQTFAAELETMRKRAVEEEKANQQRKLEELNSLIEEYRNERLRAAEKEAQGIVERHENGARSTQAEFDRKMQAERDALQERSVDVNATYQKLLDKEVDLRVLEKELSARGARLDREAQNLEFQVESLLESRQRSFDSKESQMRDECDRLRASLRQSDELLGLYGDLKVRLGGHPEEVLHKLACDQEEIKQLRRELLERPTRELQARFDALNEASDAKMQKISTLEASLAAMQKRFQEQSVLEYEIIRLKDENGSLQQRNANLDGACARLQEDLRRLNAAYQRDADRDARIREIETPFFAEYMPRAVTKNLKETDWLNCIEKACRDYGLVFGRRMLHAFHTSIKTAEWSPLTVLAGVSGTGKSELPRLYSHFGGMNFLNISVQPNWDSQESMLGFFNSIDNKFDSQPVLRLLAQAQKQNEANVYPGLVDAMTLILLDEMNLAHVEMYFAEFLSKLEQRRGLGRGEVPALDVKLGAGIAPYKLALGRNVLWVGTMNQDETTKTLSDKVIDRGFVIHFPSPTSFERRVELRPLGDRGSQAAPLLPLATWRQWCTYKSTFSEDEIRPYKAFVEGMNVHLGTAGRALGHRVWQSIEYYMANYPDVRVAQEESNTAALKRAMKMAFEDQLVLKVMPKMRGIDTRGRSKSECLDVIRGQLESDGYAIVDDFDRACQAGYGQFIWNSAEYLREQPVVMAVQASVQGEVNSKESTLAAGSPQPAA